jgi:AraC-like DNA-binding protein
LPSVEPVGAHSAAEGTGAPSLDRIYLRSSSLTRVRTTRARIADLMAESPTARPWDLGPMREIEGVAVLQIGPTPMRPLARRRRQLSPRRMLVASETDWRRMSDYRLLEALDQLLTEPPKSWRVSRLITLSGLSSSRCRELFVISFGRSPRSYLLELRMVHAGQLLTEQRKTVKETAAILDVDVSHFVRDFEKYFKMTPSRFKRQSLANPRLSAMWLINRRIG